MKATDSVEFDRNILTRTARTGRVTHTRNGWVTIVPDEPLPNEWVTVRRAVEQVKVTATVNKTRRPDEPTSEAD